MTTLDTTATAAPRAQAWRVALLLFGSGCCGARLSDRLDARVPADFRRVDRGVGRGAGDLRRRARPWRARCSARAPTGTRARSFTTRSLEAIVAVSAALTPLRAGRRAVRSISRCGGTPALGTAGGNHPAPAAQHDRARRADLRRWAARCRPRPAASPAANDVRRQDVAALYGLNTLGAVVGCVASTFFLLEIFGTRNTLWLAAGAQRDRRRCCARRWSTGSAGRDSSRKLPAARRSSRLGAGADLVPAGRVRRGRASRSS